MKPLVSIVIPVYNTEKYIRECIDSALNQTYDNVEIIAVNDGSSDGSLDILKSYDNKIKIITKENGGTASALNIGIKHMCGEWFKWLSADDLLYPSAIEDLISYANSIQNSEKCILYGNHDCINSKGDIIKQIIEPNYNNMDHMYCNIILLDHFYGNALSSLIHVSAFKKYGAFNETVKFNEDYEMWLRLCIIHGFKLIQISKTVSKYRIHENQLTQITNIKAIKHNKIMKKHILDQLDSKQRNQYEIEIKKNYKSKPIRIRFRKYIRDILISILGETMAGPIIKFYISRIKRDIIFLK